MNRKISVTWTWQDVNSLRPDLSQADCENILDLIGRQLSERSIEAGWEIMSDLITIMEMGNK